jgi:hypothetical protein
MKFIVILATLFFNSITPVFAQTSSWTSQQPGRCVRSIVVNPNNLGKVTYNDVASIQGLECLFFNVLQVIVFLAGIAFLFMFISGGFKYLFSSGEQKAVAAASSTLTMAFIGLVGIIASWLIISFIQKFTGVNITNFIIPG